ncbi:TIGR04076 family protein [[Eubacterium] cellulosolvens]
MTSYKLIITVKEIKGTCAANKVGDRIEVVGDEIKGKICSMAMHAIFPYIFAMQYGADFPWLENKDEILAYCPDPTGLALFEIKREKIPE